MAATPPPVNDVPRRPKSTKDAARESVITLEYAKFFSNVGLSVQDAAQAYASNRSQLVQRTILAQDMLANPVWAAQANLLHKVLRKAEFVPAHPGRYEQLRMGTPQYMVFHRPGADAPSCTFQNLMLTFLIPPEYDDNKTQAAHFAVGPAGQLAQFIDLADKSHHVGDGSSVNNANSVGVEISGSINEPITEEQFEAVADLTAMLSVIYPGITLNNKHLILHQNIARDRRDPGQYFNFTRVLTRAAQIRAKISGFSADSFFKTPFDPVALVSSQATALIDAANVSLPPGQRALQISAASNVLAYTRLDRKSFDRSQTSVDAQAQANATLDWIRSDTATREVLDSQYNEAVRSLSPAKSDTRRNSANLDGFNWATGVWKNGQPR